MTPRPALIIFQDLLNELPGEDPKKFHAKNDLDRLVGAAVSFCYLR